jgi:serine/threonine-protein kinase RsbW
MHAVTEFELILPARAENVALVRHALRGFAEEAEVDDDLLADMTLAVTEACANVVVHAYRTVEGTLEVSAQRDERGLTVLVRDRGGGMAPRIDSPGLGLGLPVIAAVADQVEIRPADSGGTEVCMSFTLGRRARA